MATVHTMRLNDPWFDFVKTGVKTYEGRANKKPLAKGDIIEFNHPTDKKAVSFRKEIEGICYFSSFEEAMTKLPLDQILPNVKTVSDGVEIYKKFISLEAQEKMGVVMIKLK